MKCDTSTTESLRHNLMYFGLKTNPVLPDGDYLFHSVLLQLRKIYSLEGINPFFKEHIKQLHSYADTAKMGQLLQLTWGVCLMKHHQYIIFKLELVSEVSVVSIYTYGAKFCTMIQIGNNLIFWKSSLPDENLIFTPSLDLIF